MVVSCGDDGGNFFDIELMGGFGIIIVVVLSSDGVDEMVIIDEVLDVNIIDVGVVLICEVVDDMSGIGLCIDSVLFDSFEFEV